MKKYVLRLKEHGIEPELAERLGAREAALSALDKGRRRILAQALAGQQWHPSAAPLATGRGILKSVMCSAAQLGAGGSLIAGMLPPATASSSVARNTVNQAQLARSFDRMAGSGMFSDETEPAGRSDMYPSADMGYFPSNRFSEENVQEIRSRNNYYAIAVTRRDKSEL